MHERTLYAPAPRRLVAIVGVAIVVGTCQWPSAAAAQTGRIEQARQLFTEGVAAAEAEDWTRAEDCFRRARGLHASPALALNHATALSHLGRLRDGAELLRALVADAAVAGALREEARALLVTLEPRIGRLTIVVHGGAGATFAVDGVEIRASELGTPLPIDPGTHAVTASRLGVEVLRVEAVVADGAVVETMLDVPEPVVVLEEPAVEPVVEEPVVPAAALEAAPPDAPPPAPPGENLAESGWLWLGIGVGVAVVAAVAIPVALTLSAPAAPPMPTCGNVGCWYFDP